MSSFMSTPITRPAAPTTCDAMKHLLRNDSQVPGVVIDRTAKSFHLFLRRFAIAILDGDFDRSERGHGNVGLSCSANTSGKSNHAPPAWKDNLSTSRIDGAAGAPRALQESLPVGLGVDVGQLTQPADAEARLAATREGFLEHGGCAPRHPGEQTRLWSAQSNQPIASILRRPQD